MTTHNPLRSLLAAPRQLAAWALVGYTGLYLIIAFLTWLVPADLTNFAFRSRVAGFTALVELALPLIAVLLAAAVGPPVPHARLIATVALVEYGVILFFGGITFLVGLGGFRGQLDPNTGLAVLSYLVLGLGRLALAAVAALVTYQAWTKVGGSLAALTRPSPPAPRAGEPAPPGAPQQPAPPAGP